MTHRDQGEWSEAGVRDIDPGNSVHSLPRAVTERGRLDVLQPSSLLSNPTWARVDVSVLGFTAS